MTKWDELGWEQVGGRGDHAQEANILFAPSLVLNGRKREVNICNLFISRLCECR